MTSHIKRSTRHYNKMIWSRIQSVITLWICLIFQLTSHTMGIDPKFDPSTRMRLVLVPADAAVGSVIYRLRATDEEFDYPLQFELSGDASSSTVQIQSLPCTKYNSVCQANVVLTRRLEAGRYYDFQVSVKDTKGGMAMQSCSITATNFTTPHDVIFPHKPAIIMIPEDAKRGTELDYVIARKNPLYTKPVYLELWGSPLFAIRQKIATPETTEGTILLLGPLDFETQSMYHLTVLANDAYAEGGQDTRNIAGLEVVVIVEDVQDVPPIFTVAPPVTRLLSGLLPGDKVLQVHAEDGDKGNPREIRYGLVSEGNPFTSFFDINDTSGEIFLLRPLDEISYITHVGDPVLLTIVAEEVKVTRDEPPAMASTVQLAFFLPERSNSPPYFENDHYIARIDENSPQGTALVFSDPYVSRVYDDDTGKNGVFSLTLLGNNGTFEISPNVAERRASFLVRVRDNQYLDYESRHSVGFQILAQELGPATNLSATVNVTIYINDINDNLPVFEQEVYIVELPENMTAGTKIVQVKANDVDTGNGGKIRYTQILGYLNTSLNLDPQSGLIVVSTDNHGFDREQMPEYHLYVEARDDDGTGNSAQVPLVIKVLDVNDNAPIFEKSLYEFILSPDLRNFTAPAFIKATDRDAEEPNNVIRYEIINGNYENKFKLDKVTGQLTLLEPLMMTKNHKRRRRQAETIDTDVFVLTARAYDLGVPVMFSTTTIRVYPPESRVRTVTFVVPGSNPDRKKTEDILSTVTGGRVIIHDIRPYNGFDPPSATTIGGDSREKSVVVATVLYDSNSIVDIAQIQNRLSTNNSARATAITTSEDAEMIYKAENRVLFWLLIFLALLIALSILTLLFCCICSWCPLYAASRKRVIRVNSSEDDVHLVHRELGVGKQTKSVQVAEWMGRREAWSADRSSDSRTKPTHWEFSRRVNNRQKLRHEHHEHEIEPRVRSADDKRSIKIRNNLKDIKSTKETQIHNSQIHNSRTNLINDRDIYVEDIIDHADDQDYVDIKKKRISDQQIEDDLRRHEIDRGSDIGYDQRNNMKRQIAHENENGTNRDHLYIKDGNAEILRLITRGKQEEENIYVNVPPVQPQPQPQYIMVDNSGKEILMRRFIEEQANGKHIIREHYQILPGTQVHQSLPNEVNHPQHMNELYVNKSQAGSAIYSQIDPTLDLKLLSSQNLAKSDQQFDTQRTYNIPTNQSMVHQELETSLKQQNALLRQILLEKAKLEEKYSQQEVALETQSLPGHSMAIATQTDCETGTQTDEPFNIRPARRRARSENDDSMSESDYEYIRYSPPNSPEGVYWIKRKRHKKKSKHRDALKPRRRVVMVEEIKRKIRTPIEEENEDQKSPVRSSETKSSIFKRLKKEGVLKRKELSAKSTALKKDVLMEISDSLDEHKSPSGKSKNKQLHRIHKKQIEYFDDSDDDSDDNDQLRKDSYSGDSLEDYSEIEESQIRRSSSRISRSKAMLRRGSSIDIRDVYNKDEDYIKYVSDSIASTPAIRHRLSRKDSKNDADSKRKSKRDAASEPPVHRSSKGPAPKIPISKSSKIPSTEKSRSETDILRKMEEDSGQSSRSVPKYMEWYYNKNRESDSEKKRLDNYRLEKEKSKISNKKIIGSTEKRIKAKAPRPDGQSMKPEPLPRTSAPKGIRMLKEDMEMNKTHNPKIQTDANHPLLQYSEHRYEHEYNPAPDIPIPPTKLPHYMYPETPPQHGGSSDTKQKAKPSKPRPSPIKENEVKTNSHTVVIPIESTETNPNQSKQLNASTLEDDLDSGIAMNSLLNSMGRRNPIADKKSVFTIAYDDVKVKKIQSESDSPQFS